MKELVISAIILLLFFNLLANIESATNVDREIEDIRTGTVISSLLKQINGDGFQNKKNIKLLDMIESNSEPYYSSLLSSRPPILPDNFKVGDLMFIECVSFFTNFCSSWDHVAIYIGNNLFVEANDYTSIPRPLGGTKGVQITPLWKYKLWTQYCAFATVKSANETQQLAAVEWAIAQIGEDNFQTSWKNGEWWANPDPNDESDPNAKNWYCAELPWAAYYNTSNGTINLDAHPEPFPPPMGDGIHFTVLPQDIASHENVTMYSETGAPLPPTRPHGNLKMVTLPQIGVYTTTSTNDPDQDLYYQWAWGNTFRPDPWEFVSGKSGKTITKIHAWKRLNIHDRRENNFYFDIRVRCKNKLGRISNWSEPYSVHVTPNNLKTDWVSPTGNIDNDWTYEENAYDEKPSISSAIYTKINDNDWCDDPLVLTLDEPIHIKGFRIHVTKGLFHDKMKLCFYNGSTHIQTLNYTNWPNLRWKIVDLHRYGYQVDRVEIWFHMNSPLFSRGFFSSPVRVYEFSFWKTDDYG